MNTSKIYLLAVIFILSYGLMTTSCDGPEDLGAVSGIQGTIQFQGDMPDSIKAVALVILEPEAYTNQDSIGKYLISYSDPLLQSGEYYIQLKPGIYIGVIIGLLIDPGVFVANLQTYLDGPNLPLVQLSEGLNSVIVEENVVQSKEWEVSF